MRKIVDLLLGFTVFTILITLLSQVSLGVSCTVGNWSEWSAEKTQDYLAAEPVNQKQDTQYCYRDIQKTTVKTYSEKTTLVQQGWNWDSSTAKTGTPVTSGWTTTKPAEMENRKINQRTSSKVTGYRYKRYVYKNAKGQTMFTYGSSYADSMGFSGSWKFKQTTSKLPYYKTYDGKYDAYGNGADYWWPANCNTKQGKSYNGQDYTIFEVKTSYTEYQTLDYPYTLTKWPTNYSAWSFEKVELIQGQRDVKTRTVYSFRITSHRFVDPPVIEKYPTCTELGRMYQVCSACGEKVYTSIKMRDHDYSTEWTVDTPATCLRPGSKSHHCITCGKKSDISTIPPTGHTFTGEWNISQQPTCTEEGLKYQLCATCGQIGNETVLSPTGHTYKTNTTPASMSKNGSMVETCTACGEIKSSVDIPRIEKILLNNSKYIYNGKTATPKVTIVDSNGEKLIRNRDYKLKYPSGRKECGSYKIKIVFIGNYTGSAKKSFKIVLGKVTGLKQLKKEGICLQWNKVEGATRYQVQGYDKKNKQWVPLGRVGETRTNQLFNSSIRNVSMKIRVRAVRDSGVGAWSGITAKARAK